MAEKNLSMTLNAYITKIDYPGKALPIFSAAGNIVFLFSSITVNGIPVWIASARINLVFLFTNEMVKKKIENNGEEKHRKIAFMGRSKLNNKGIIIYNSTDRFRFQS